MSSGSGLTPTLVLGALAALAVGCSKGDQRVLAPDASCQADSQCAAPWACFEGSCQDLRIQFLAPSGDRLFADGLVELQFGLPGIQPDELALEVNGAARSLAGRSATFDLGAEGTYRLAGLARFGDRWSRSQVREVVVDQTPPTVAWSLPPGQYELPGVSRLQGTFSEPIDASVAFEVVIDGTFDRLAAVTLAEDRDDPHRPAPRDHVERCVRRGGPRLHH